MSFVRLRLLFALTYTLVSPLAYGTDDLLLLLQTSSTNSQTQADLSWMSAPESFYEVLTATNVAGPWIVAHSVPLATTALTGKMRSLSSDKNRFFKVRELDTRGPTIQYRYPLNGMVGIGRLAPIEVTLEDESGIRTNAFRLIVNGVSLLPANNANTRVTTNSFTYTPTSAWGDYGTTVTVSFVCFDTRTNSTVESWSFSLEEPVTVAENVLVVGGSAPASSLRPRPIKPLASELAIIEIASDRVVFSYSGAAHGITPGMLLVNDDVENLFYRRVTSLQEDTLLNRLTVYTTDVPLTELLTSGTFESSQFEWVDPGSGAAVQSLSPDAHVLPILNSYSYTYGVYKTFPTAVVQSSANNVSFDGVIKLNLRELANFSFAIKNKKIECLNTRITESRDVQMNGHLTFGGAMTGQAVKVADMASMYGLSAPVFLGSIVGYWQGVPVGVSYYLNQVDLYAEAVSDKAVSSDLDVSELTQCVCATDIGHQSNPTCESFSAPYTQQRASGGNGFSGKIHVYLKTKFTVRFHGIADISLTMGRGPELSGSWHAEEGRYQFSLCDRYSFHSELAPVGSNTFYVGGTQQSWPLLHRVIPVTVWLWPEAPISQPRFTLQPVGVTATQDTTVVLSACASGSPEPRYEWYQNNDVLPGKTSPILSFTMRPQAIGTYKCKALNPFGFRYSDSVTVNLATPASEGMVRIPAGSFQMGDTFATEWTGIEGLPVHTVYLDEFHIDRYEVTYEKWTQVRDWSLTHGYDYTFAGSGKTNYPAYGMCWYDMVKWCNARSEMEGHLPAYYTLWDFNQVYKSGQHAPYCNWKANGYRLPTEAEWEKAARGGLTGKRFPWGGNTISHTYANYWSSMKNWMPYDVNPTDGYHPDYMAGGSPYLNPVNAFAPNGYGLYNMTGNVAEFCWDRMDSNCGYYSTSPLSNPRGPDVATTPRVHRGGAWNLVSIFGLCSSRDCEQPYVSSSAYCLGFRVVISGQK